MKIIISYFMISILLIVHVSAQNRSFDTNIVLKKLEVMKKELKLSQKQADSLKPLLLDHFERNEMFKKNIVVIHDIQKQNDQSTEFEMSKILTSEQYKQYMDKKNAGIEFKRSMKINEKMAFYRQELKINDQQYTDLKLLLWKSMLQREDLKMKYKNDDALLKQEMKKVKTSFNDQLSKILTKEQLAKYKEIHNSSKK